MNKEEMKIKEFDKEQLEILLNDLQDIDKFIGFKDGAFKYELGKYQADLLVNCIKKYKEVIDKLKTNIENDIDGFITINEFGESNEILELLDIYSDILKEVK